MRNLIAVGIGILVGLLQWSSTAIAQTRVAEAGAYPKAYLQAFHGNQTTLTNAIDAIQQSTGGKVIEIRFSAPNGKAGFHTVVAQNNEVKAARFEPPATQLKQISDNPDWMLKWQQKTEVKLATAAPVPLSKAIQTAEAAQGAPAIAAGMARSAATSDVHAYNIMLDDKGSLKRMAIDSSTGEIIADLSGFEQWPQW
jgi:uncharacterized membrane protein YkoI